MSNHQKIALVTGALGGIGTAICHALLQQNYKVLATYTPNPDQPSRTEQWCQDENIDPNQITFIAVDLSLHEKAHQIIEQAVEQAGRIDVLVNNAGMTRDAGFKKMSFQQWSDVIQTNLTSLYTVTHPVFLKMLEQHFGRIINISSINGLKGQFGQTNYSATKAGMIGFSKALAQEGAKFGITVNAIAPGYTATKMVMAVPEKVLDGIKANIPMNRLAEPDEIAAAVLYLISDGAAFITGETININGGQYMH